METNNIMTNEATEVEEEVMTNNSNKALVNFGIAGGLLLVGGLAYKYIIKPINQKRKNAKEVVKVEDTIVDAEEGSFTEVTDSNDKKEEK